MASQNCEICGGNIDMQIFKNTGVCCELCRKARVRAERLVESKSSPVLDALAELQNMESESERLDFFIEAWVNEFGHPPNMSDLLMWEEALASVKLDGETVVIPGTQYEP